MVARTSDKGTRCRLGRMSRSDALSTCSRAGVATRKSPGALTFRYLRVSKDTQDLDKHRADILILANKEDLGRVEFVEEKVSGKIPWRKRRVAAVLGELR